MDNPDSKTALLLMLSIANLVAVGINVRSIYFNNHKQIDVPEKGTSRNRMKIVEKTKLKTTPSKIFINGCNPCKENSTIKKKKSKRVLIDLHNSSSSLLDEPDTLCSRFYDVRKAPADVKCKNRQSTIDASNKIANKLKNKVNRKVIPAVVKANDKVTDKLRLQKHLNNYTTKIVNAINSTICPVVNSLNSQSSGPMKQPLKRAHRKNAFTSYAPDIVSTSSDYGGNYGIENSFSTILGNSKYKISVSKLAANYWIKRNKMKAIKLKRSNKDMRTKVSNIVDSQVTLKNEISSTLVNDCQVTEKSTKENIVGEEERWDMYCALSGAKPESEIDKAEHEITNTQSEILTSIQVENCTNVNTEPEKNEVDVLGSACNQQEKPKPEKNEIEVLGSAINQHEKILLRNEKCVQTSGNSFEQLEVAQNMVFVVENVSLLLLKYLAMWSNSHHILKPQTCCGRTSNSRCFRRLSRPISFSTIEFGSIPFLGPSEENNERNHQVGFGTGTTQNLLEDQLSENLVEDTFIPINDKIRTEALQTYPSQFLFKQTSHTFSESVKADEEEKEFIAHSSSCIEIERSRGKQDDNNSININLNEENCEGNDHLNLYEEGLEINKSMIGNFSSNDSFHSWSYETSTDDVFLECEPFRIINNAIDILQLDSKIVDFVEKHKNQLNEGTEIVKSQTPGAKDVKSQIEPYSNSVGLAERENIPTTVTYRMSFGESLPQIKSSVTGDGFEIQKSDEATLTAFDIKEYNSRLNKSSDHSRSEVKTTPPINDSNSLMAGENELKKSQNSYKDEINSILMPNSFSVGLLDSENSSDTSYLKSSGESLPACHYEDIKMSSSVTGDVQKLDDATEKSYKQRRKF